MPGGWLFSAGAWIHGVIAIGGHCYSELGGTGHVCLLLVVHCVFGVVVVAVGFLKGYC